MAAEILRNLKGIKSKNPHQTNHRYGTCGNHSFCHRAQRYLVAQLLFSQQSALHVYHPETGKKQTLQQLITGNNKNSWLQSLSNEWGRLAQGNQFGINGTDTIEFILYSTMP